MKYSLNFHKTFSPERDAIAQLLRLSKQSDKFLTKEEISQLTTIPTGASSGKVVPNINYAEFMGLINVETKGKRFKVFPTILGDIIYNEDPYFVESITLWSCHYNLVSKGSKAILWSFVFNELVPQLGTEIQKEVLSNIVCKNFESEVNLTPLRSSYLNDTSFAALNIMIDEGKNYIFTPHKIEPSYKYLYAYQLLSNWEKLAGDMTEITITDLKEKLYFGVPYLWSDRDILNVIELLQDERIILINRQLNPLTIVRQESSQVLLSQIYSLLI
ncbi:DUF4007 family protein [Neobacillus ginsengisoli]|uniref:DUF4007 domain-containing protein n=1 Tax=Neobacillus ginsengisoli TaxID=904295 RepID=A0ABT9XZR2_9BACI|nr:DUF4007 family protein [Neobacillus ginsengisoli]MDQ0201067.1 hypothetical protein [Neobacillus ginsengisoli]